VPPVRQNEITQEVLECVFLEEVANSDVSDQCKIPNGAVSDIPLSECAGEMKFPKAPGSRVIESGEDLDVSGSKFIRENLWSDKHRRYGLKKFPANMERKTFFQLASASFTTGEPLLQSLRWRLRH
jgi:hypothetical protein